MFPVPILESGAPKNYHAWSAHKVSLIIIKLNAAIVHQINHILQQIISVSTVDRKVNGILKRADALLVNLPTIGMRRKGNVKAAQNTITMMKQ